MVESFDHECHIFPSWCFTNVPFPQPVANASLSPFLPFLQGHLQYHNSQRSGNGGGLLHGQLRAAQSVDHLHHRAQLEEKDKAIEALKQAAKVRQTDWQTDE